MLGKQNRAYVGLSTPIAFDYKAYHAEKRDYPNPLLEAPLGLFLMYDEIWFLDPFVCPYNVADHELEYVKFVTDRYELSDVIELDLEPPKPGPSEYFWEDWNGIVRNIAPFAQADNHSKVYVAGVVPDSRSPRNVAIDQTVAATLDLELISNTPTSGWLRSVFVPQAGMHLTERLVSNRVPNYQSAEGPYFDGLDDLRRLPHLRRFRKKVQRESLTMDSKTLEEVVEGIEEDFATIRNETLLSRVGRGRVYEGSLQIAAIAASEAAKAIPLVGQIYGVASAAKDIGEQLRDRKKYGWAGFLANVELAQPGTRGTSSGSDN